MKRESSHLSEVAQVVTDPLLNGGDLVVAQVSAEKTAGSFSEL